MKNNILNLFGLGKTPFSASTASLAGLALFWLISLTEQYQLPIQLIVFAIVLFWTSVAIFRTNADLKNDPKEIVIDEFLGMFLLLLVAGTSELNHLLVLFIAFRFYDIFKFPPITWLDKIKNGFGILADDLALGILLGALYRLFLFLMP